VVCSAVVAATHAATSQHAAKQLVLLLSIQVVPLHAVTAVETATVAARLLTQDVLLLVLLLETVAARLLIQDVLLHVVTAVPLLHAVQHHAATSDAAGSHAAIC
jgi:hypothetical protein